MENNNKLASQSGDDHDKTSIEILNTENTGQQQKDSSGISTSKAGAMAAGAGIAGAGLGAAAQGHIANLQKEEADLSKQDVTAQPVSNPTPATAQATPSPTPDTVDGSSVKLIPDSSTPASDSSEIVAPESTPDPQPAYMGFAVQGENGSTVQVVFVDENHDGQIDQWGMQATDVTGVTQEVTGTAEQLPEFLLGGNANYAQQADYQNETTEITGMDDSFEPVDWASEQEPPVVAEETDSPLSETDAEEIPEAVATEIPEETASATPDFAEYEQQMEHVQFQEWELPDHYQQDDFQGNDDFVANQFI
jgi:hypothetical protein